MAIKVKAPRILAAGKTFYGIRRKRILATLNQCSGILCPSKFLLNQLKDTGVDSNRLIHWPFGIDCSGATKQQKTTSITSTTPITFGYTGTLEKQKGVNILLKAFAELPEKFRKKAVLKIYGNTRRDGQTVIRVRNWQKKYSSIPEIIFLGEYSKDQLNDIHKSLDVIVVPSIWFENRPLTILEAIVRGNPVLGSDIGGISELLQESNAGWTFPAGDTDKLRAHLELLIEKPELINAKRSELPFIPDVNDEVENLIKLYSENQ